MAVLFDKPCRLCLSDLIENVDIFSDDCDDKNLSKMIHKLFSFWIKPTDVLSKCLCIHCIKIVNDYYTFSIRVKECQKILSKTKDNKILIENKSPPSNISEDIVKNEDLHFKTSLMNSSPIKVEVLDLIPSTDFETIGINNFSLNKGWSVSEAPIKFEECYDTDHNISGDCDQYDSLEAALEELGSGEVHKETILLKQKKCKSTKSSQGSKNKVKKKHKSEYTRTTPTEADSSQEEFALTDVSTEIFKNGKLNIKGLLLDSLINKFYNIHCDMCATTRKFKQISELFQHFESEHDTKGYVTCCKSRLFTRQKICMHMARHIQPSAFECPICKKPVSRPNNLKIHLQTHLPDSEKSFKCHQCDKRYSGIDGLNSHKLTHVPIEDRKTYDCKICGKRFTLPKSYFGHIRSVHANIKYLCAECGRSFQTKTNLTLHMMTHDPEGKNKAECPHCGFICKSKQYLSRHIKIHSPDRIRCSLCDFSTHLKSQLYKHVRVKHSDSKPFVCVVCGKEFKLKNGLRTHMSQHTGERRYSCTFCPKTFVSSGNYYTHRRRMHSDQFTKKPIVKTDVNKILDPEPSNEELQESRIYELARQQIRILEEKQ